MLAYIRCGRSPSDDSSDAAAGRVAASLGLFAGQAALHSARGAARFFKSSRASPGRRPAAGKRAPALALTEVPSGSICLFNGEIDNRGELAAALGVSGAEDERLYALAFERWGDACDRHIVGDYCALIQTADGAVRLSRAPWRGPPLIYVHDRGRTIVASVPRALIAAGIEQRVNPNRLVDSLLLNDAGSDGWIAGSRTIEIGTVIWLYPDGTERVDAWYDHMAPRETRLPRRADYVEAVEALLRTATAAALDRAAAPGAFLSGGLDSANVAVRAAAQLPQGKRLKTFTFRPDEAYIETEDPRYFGDDWPAVQELAALHPGIDAYSARAGDYAADWEKMFLACGAAPFALQNMSLYHPILQMARQQGCDVVLDAEMGNVTFSIDGDWCYTEYLLRGRWRELARAIRAHRPPRGPLAWAFLWNGIAPLLPDAAWRLWQRAKGRRNLNLNLDVSSLRADAPATQEGLARLKAAGIDYSRGRPASRNAWMQDAFGRGSGGMGEINQAFEQIYGLRIRDVTSYRPLVEFCLGLPTDMFMHQGTSRWLARELGRGLLPEAQRTNRRYGFHNCDWHERLTPKLAEFKREIDAARSDPLLSELLDFRHLDDLYARWPSASTLERSAVERFVMAAPRAAIAARYARFMSGRNLN